MFADFSAQMSEDMATDHVNGNGTEEPMDTTAEVTHSEHFQALLEAGLPQNVAEKLDELYVAGKRTPCLRFQLTVCAQINPPSSTQCESQ